MTAGDIETFRRDGIWFNRIAGESRTRGSRLEDESEAIKVGRNAATAPQVERTVRTEEGPSADARLYDLHPRELTS